MFTDFIKFNQKERWQIIENVGKRKKIANYAKFVLEAIGI